VQLELPVELGTEGAVTEFTGTIDYIDDAGVKTAVINVS